MSATAAKLRRGRDWYASSAPTVDNDSSQEPPFNVTDTWTTTAGATYVCWDDSPGAAQWVETDGSGGGGGGSGTPASTVTSERTLNHAATVVGVSTDYARADHSHGTPAMPSASDVGADASGAAAAALVTAEAYTDTAVAGRVPATRTVSTTAPLTGGGDLSANRTIAISDFVASGASHARGAVPDPGAAAGTTKFLREDASWATPPDTNGASVLTTKGDLLGYSTTPARVAVGADGSILVADSNASTGLSWQTAAPPGCGSGHDGSVHYTGPTTLTGPVNAADITLDAGVVVNCGGYIVRSNGVLTYGSSTSAFNVSGTNASGTTAGQGGGAATELGAGTAGGAGFTTASAGNVGSSRTNSWPGMSGTGANPGKGGTGGADSGAVHAGGAGGTISVVNAINSSIGLYAFDTGLTSWNQLVLQGGSGGGSGGCSASGPTCGAGGGGGGVAIVWANKVVGDGKVTANGGAGSAAVAATGSAGGGGGGGGGAAVLLARVVQGAAVAEANGGAGGAGAGGGASGSAGNAGFAGNYRI